MLFLINPHFLNKSAKILNNKELSEILNYVIIFVKNSFQNDN